MALEKATLNKYNEKGEKIVDSIKVLFNPNEYTVDINNKYSSHKVPGTSLPVTQFSCGLSSVLSVNLFFDSSEENEDVRVYTSPITDLMKIDRDIGAPAIVEFAWGKFMFKGVIENINQNFLVFTSAGIPTRAKLTVKMTEIEKSEQIYKKGENIKKEVKKKEKKETLEDTLKSVQKKSEEILGYAEDWRKLAEKFDVDDPKKSLPGLGKLAVKHGKKLFE